MCSSDLGLTDGEGGTLATPGMDVLRQVVYANLLAHGERDGPLDTVLQLADVAGPRVTQQAFGRDTGKPTHPLAGALTINRSTKCWASSSTSVPRARRGGSSIWMTATRKKRSSIPPGRVSLASPSELPGSVAHSAAGV